MEKGSFSLSQGSIKTSKVCIYTTPPQIQFTRLHWLCYCSYCKMDKGNTFNICHQKKCRHKIPIDISIHKEKQLFTKGKLGVSNKLANLNRKQN